ncbi:Uncharacterized protein ImpI/VasC [Rhodovulum sp. P5]|uniref:type VI secretion system-associated FHA domain protein TagH n=1 Tax=Rhodovulum sp. P5 TaxID=1564506 RepID=UPI0009C24B78|nr:type VI secretion system-associated FHA domain protein TagH [Rhodovulum sp. P5]ARE41206.1 Uncharacterized protein ImpI/VasC [Rhodovulum sp. P5]
MMLVLRIENVDHLDNGSPSWIQLNRSGASVGRRSTMDWTLPDPNRVISGHHFDISYRNGAYYLTDMSMNGTYLVGNRSRIGGDLMLRGGERLVVGHYIIGVELRPEVHAAGTGEPGYPRDTPAPGFADPGAGKSPLRPGPAASAGWSGHASIQMPSHASYPGVSVEPQNIPGEGSGGRLQRPGWASVDPQKLPDSHFDDNNTVLSKPGLRETDWVPSAPPVKRGHGAEATQHAAHLPDANGAAPASAECSAALSAFCEAAGLDPSGIGPDDVAPLMRMLGRSVKVATDEIMLMLKERAGVKVFTHSGEQTMLGATDNNPMKFMPDSQQALTLMFTAPREGFLTGADSFAEALSDIRHHQEAVFEALQTALADVVAGLSPEEIEAATGPDGAPAEDCWQTYLDRWNAKAQAGEHGMLDAFLIAFAKAYGQAIASH